MIVVGKEEEPIVTMTTHGKMMDKVTMTNKRIGRIR